MTSESNIDGMVNVSEVDFAARLKERVVNLRSVVEAEVEDTPNNWPSAFGGAVASIKSYFEMVARKDDRFSKNEVEEINSELDDLSKDAGKLIQYAEDKAKEERISPKEVMIMDGLKPMLYDKLEKIGNKIISKL